MQNSLEVHRDPETQYQYFTGRDIFPAFYQKHFTSIEEVETELRHYAHANGFDIRLSNVERDKDGVVRMRRFVCSCEGISIKTHNQQIQQQIQRGSKRKLDDDAMSREYEDGEETTSNAAIRANALRMTGSKRCNCPYVVVYRIGQLDEDDPDSPLVYRAHKLDTFHNHKLDNILLSNATIFQEKSSKGGTGNYQFLQNFYGALFAIETYVKANPRHLPMIQNHLELLCHSLQGDHNHPAHLSQRFTQYDINACNAMERNQAAALTNRMAAAASAAKTQEYHQTMLSTILLRDVAALGHANAFSPFQGMINFPFGAVMPPSSSAAAAGVGGMVNYEDSDKHGVASSSSSSQK